MLLGKRFEELGTVGAEEWGSLFGPFDESGEPIPYDELPLVLAVRNGRPAHADLTVRSTDGTQPPGRGLRLPDPHRPRLAGRDRRLLAGAGKRQRSGAGVKVKLWGTRGSIPSPGPETIRYGGNTSCVGVTLSDGSMLALDAGTGIRSLGLALADEPARLHILLTHLHLDHIQGLVFFAPAFRPQTEIVIWGPASPEASLRDRIARYISAPLSPVEVRELPCDVSFRHCPRERVGDRLGADPRRLGRPPRPDPRLPDRRRRLLPRLHPRPRAGARRRPRRARGGLDLRPRPRPRRLAADPRRPVRRRRVPRPRRLGPLLAPRTRSPSPGAPAPSAPSSSTTTRCTPTSDLDELGARSARALARARRRRGDESSWPPSGPSTSCRPARPARFTSEGRVSPGARIDAGRASARRWSKGALETARRPTRARPATAAAGCPTSTTRSRSPRC